MRAIQIPYPVPKEMTQFAEAHELHGLERTVDFPERRISYCLYDDKEQDFKRCVMEVQKAVAACSPGTEPPRLEIRLSTLP